MKNFKWWHYLSVGSFVAGWVARSFADKKITRQEMTELVNGILDMLDITEIEIEL